MDTNGLQFVLTQTCPVCLHQIFYQTLLNAMMYILIYKLYFIFFWFYLHSNNMGTKTPHYVGKFYLVRIASMGLA